MEKDKIKELVKLEIKASDDKKADEKRRKVVTIREFEIDIPDNGVRWHGYKAIAVSDLRIGDLNINFSFDKNMSSKQIYKGLKKGLKKIILNGKL